MALTCPPTFMTPSPLPVSTALMCPTEPGLLRGLDPGPEASLDTPGSGCRERGLGPGARANLWGCSQENGEPGVGVPAAKRPWPSVSPKCLPSHLTPAGLGVSVGLPSCAGVGFGSSAPSGRPLLPPAVGRQPKAPGQPPGLAVPQRPASVPAVTVHEGDEWHSCRGPEGMWWGRFGHCPLSQQPGIGWNR